MSVKSSMGRALLSSGVLFSFFQNCSRVDFQTTPSVEVPMCKDVSAPEVKPKLLWDWLTELPNSPDHSYPNFNQTMASPVVADLDGDKKPEVVFVNFTTKASEFFSDASTVGYLANGVLRIVEGGTGRTKLSVGQMELAPYASQAPLLMDIDGDGKTEIFYVHYDRKSLVALNYDGTKRWVFNFPDGVMSIATAGVTGGDINQDGKGDIVLGKYVITEDAAKSPKVLLTLPLSINQHYTALALPLDPSHPERINIVNHQGMFRSDGTQIGDNFAGGLYFAAGDLYPEISGLEVVATGKGYLRILNGLTGAMIRAVDLKDYNELVCPAGSVGGGPPSIGDFDGDKSTLEIAVATGRHLTIFNSQGEPKYKTTTQDCSSLVTGLTSFDLNGDGKPEVLYSDEEYLRIFEIVDGKLKIVHQIVNPSGTLYEYPVVADITGTGAASLLLAGNNYAVNIFYKDPSELSDAAEAAKITGVRAFTSSAEKSWMPTRPVWNQYSFHPDLISDSAKFLISPRLDGRIFRRNNQGIGKELRCRNQ